jgi:putative two-component system response regulator
MNDLHDAHILIVDDQESNILLLERLLEHHGYKHVTSIKDSSQTLTHFEQGAPDLLLLDLQMPDPDGFEVMKLIKRWTTGESHVPILVLTADASLETKRRALNAGARDFLSKPLDAIEVTLRIRHLLETRQLQLQLRALNDALEDRVRKRTNELENSRLEAFQQLALAGEYRDDDTREHTKRVGFAAGMLARELGLNPTMVEVIEKIAPLHDLGKIGISDAILLKPSTLTEDEFTIMKTHTTIGAKILSESTSPLLALAAEIALTHHEHWDGSGYPSGLTHEQIPIGGRVVGLVDAFDAMTHIRPYKHAMPITEASAETKRSAGSHFDPTVVAAFMRVDPERLLSPPLPPPPTSLTEPAWRTLQDLPQNTRNRAPAPTSAA